MNATILGRPDTNEKKSAPWRDSSAKLIKKCDTDQLHSRGLHVFML